ncbi:hypothetical protein V6243_07150 [Cobetia marina]|uniref:Uncharacterized protein n=1 Tax=Cobetia marina TaxID=28258 RepID=A0ABU9GGK8_COBMA
MTVPLVPRGDAPGKDALIDQQPLLSVVHRSARRQVLHLILAFSSCGRLVKPGLENRSRNPASRTVPRQKRENGFQALDAGDSEQANNITIPSLLHPKSHALRNSDLRET